MTNYRFPLLCVLLIAFAIGAAPAPNAMAAAEEAEPETAVCVAAVAADLAGIAADLGPCIQYGSCEVCEVNNLPPGCVVKICPDGEGGETHEVDCGDPD